MKIVVTVSELFDRSIFGETCDLLEIIEFPNDNGKIDFNREVTLTPGQAATLGLIEEGERW